MHVEPTNYNTLAAQVAARIVREISRGTWISALPSERALTETLQVSRKTVRKSIAQLQRDGLIKTSCRLGHRIVQRTRAADTTQQLTIGLLAPEALDKLPSYTALWIDEFRTLLFEHGIRLVAFSSNRLFSRGMSDALARITQQSPQTCWILTHSNENIQRWFLDRQVPCVVAGSRHPGVPLPNVDLDYFAVCRHAVGAMLRHGHRRVAFLTQRSQRAGDLDGEAGFLDAVRRSWNDLEYTINHHDGTTDGVWRMLTRMFNGSSRPTALLVAKPNFYLTAMSFLADRGLRIGDDVSLICRDHDTFLSSIRPMPTGYAFRPKTYARRLLPMVLALVRNQKVAHLDLRIEPEFIAGGSLGPLAR